MITGELKSQIDRIWDSFWSGGIANPLEVIEQITFLLFIKRLDELEELRENELRTLGESDKRQIFPDGLDAPEEQGGRAYADYRWSRFKHFSAQDMYDVVSKHVFPFLATVGGEGTTYESHMAEARFTIPTPGLLRKAVDGLDGVPMVSRDTKGDVYEYMLSKIATAGTNGQFRTPRHIIELMVEMTDPAPGDIICDPACGTCGFLVAAGEQVRRSYPEALRDKKLSRQFHDDMFNGFDFDRTMLRIGSMNMLLHGVEQPDVRYKDSLSEEHSGEEEAYSLILANPPFAGSIDAEAIAKDLKQVVSTKKTELLFSRCSSGSSNRAAGRPSSFPTVCCSARRRPTRRCVACSSTTRSSTASSRSRPACSSPTPECRRPSCSSPGPTRAEPTTSGSTT